MFIKFSKQRNSYKKGQLTPFFIAIVVIILIASLITINVGKIALNKTYTANGSDAGALAGASVMASVFNNAAVANSEMIAAFDEFIMSVSISYTIALTSLITASVSSLISIAAAGAAELAVCPTPCLAKASIATAIKSLGVAIKAMALFATTTIAIMVSIVGFSVQQIFFYNIIRRMVKQGRDSAIDAGYSYLFSNSGISGRLKYYQREAFSNWLKSISGNMSGFDGIFNAFYSILQPLNFLSTRFNTFGLIYHWKDGWDKHHLVHGFVRINPVDTYALQITILPYPAQIGLLTGAAAIAAAVGGQWTGVNAAYVIAQIAIIAVCTASKLCKTLPFPTNLPACAAWAAGCLAIEAALPIPIGVHMEANLLSIPLYPMLASSWAGLIPGASTISNSGFDAAWATIAWIDDIIHDRMVYVLTDQFHQGQDLGMWVERYPIPVSFTIANFQGRGRIFPPAPFHDSTILFTDLPVTGATGN